MNARKCARGRKNVLIRLKEKLETRVYFPKWYLLSDYKLETKL